MQLQLCLYLLECFCEFIIRTKSQSITISVGGGFHPICPLKNKILSTLMLKSNLSPLATKRIQKELVRLQTQKHPNVILDTSCFDNNLQVVQINILGAPNTLYTNETFKLQFKFPPNYPMESPEVIFLGNAPVHPHIYSNGLLLFFVVYLETGHICLEQECYWLCALC